MSTMTDQTPAVPVRKTIRVQASPERAFAVFTDDFDNWWPRTHHIGKSPMKKAIIETYQPDLTQSSEVEVRFTAEPDGFTRLDLEHRYLERHRTGAAAMRTAVDSPNGWGGLLQLFAERLERAK